MNWQEVDDQIRQLATKMSQKPDLIVGIARGGLIPARLLAKYLDVKDVYALTFKKQGSQRVLRSEIKESLGGKQILLVEDILESGRSLKTALTYLESLGAEVKTVSLYLLPQPKIIPDYYISKQDKMPIFPWD